LDKRTRATVMAALEKFAGDDRSGGTFRARQLANHVLAAHPEITDVLAIGALTSIAQAWFRREAIRKDGRQGLLFEFFPEIRALLPVKGTWVEPNKACLQHWESLQRRLETQAATAGGRSRRIVQEFKTVRRIVRIVRWYGRGDPTVTTEEAMRRRAQFLEGRKKRRVKGTRG